MSKSHVYLYAIVSVLCVCAVMCVNNNNHTDQYRSNTTTTITTTSMNRTSSTVPSHHTSVTAQPPTTGLHLTSEETNKPLNSNISEKTPTLTSDPNGTINTNGTTESSQSKENSTKIIIPPSHTGSTSTSTKAGSSGGTGAGAGLGIFFLILILVIIISLGVILFILWRKGRTYSFDLTYTANDHNTPLQSMDHGGTFEQTNKELPALDFAEEDKNETSPTANGCAGETDKPSENQDSPEQKNVEDDSFMSDTSLTPPIKKVEFNLDLDLIGGEFVAADQAKPETSNPQQNENNNNVLNTGTGSFDFTEINLNEPQ